MLTDVLAARGYVYDASSLPTFIGPLARAYYFRSTKLAESERSERYDLFGQFSDGFQPNRRHRIFSGDRTLEEVPVTTMPLLRLPIHVSYVLYIAAISPRMALAYFRTALLLCKLTRTEPSILLHPLDFLSMHDCPEFAFFPAMNMDPDVKRTVLFQSLSMLAEMFEVMPLEEFVAGPKDLVPAAV